MARQRKADPNAPPAEKIGTKPCDCGAKVSAAGRCLETGYYPAWMVKCPLACPVCRTPRVTLEWDGGCHQCYGHTPDPAIRRRDKWKFPGDRYEVRGLHWVKVDGPRPSCTASQAQVAIHTVIAVAMRELDLPTARKRLDTMFSPMFGHLPLDIERDVMRPAAGWEPGANG